jgi:hypothetical protein
MQDSASPIQGQHQARGQRKLSPVVAGVGAAVIAAAITVALMSGPTPQTASQQAASTSKECQLIQRKLLVATTNGGGTVRFKASGFVSPTFTLTDQPQAVVFPLPRPNEVPAPEDITIEGNATGLVLTSEVSEYRRVFDRVVGSSTFSVQWKPMKGC